MSNQGGDKQIALSRLAMMIISNLFVPEKKADEKKTERV